ncbi:MAG: mechanosensitive ion channel family protein [Treponema sp.]|jgi:small-conductance mechanosensitive channel|nr:mechanosensitive ion channel family protein [Treponema sp.]
MEDVKQVNDAVQSASAVLSQTTTPFVDAFKKYFTLPFFFKLIGTILIVLIFWGIYKILVKSLSNVKSKKIKKQTIQRINRGLKYLFYIISVMYVLNFFGVNLSAIWGAAGIAGIAIGFAAQTSVSNIISGLFVTGEKALKIGDFISVDGVTGTVDAIDLISVKIHTVDNEMIRIPNSTIINTNLKNSSFFKCRRMNIHVSVSYDTDLKKALEAIKKAPDLCPTVLKEPFPQFWYEGFGDSGVNLALGIWFHGEDYYTVRNEAFIAVKKVFDDAAIEIPYNKLDVNVTGMLSSSPKKIRKKSRKQDTNQEYPQTPTHMDTDDDPEIRDDLSY